MKSKIINNLKSDKPGVFEQSAPEISYRNSKNVFVSYKASVLNAVSALFNRQVGTKVVPDHKVIYELGVWFNSKIVPKYQKSAYFNYDLDDYDLDQPDKKKVRNYTNWFVNLFDYKKTMKSAQDFTGFAKGNEYAYENEDQVKKEKTT